MKRTISFLLSLVMLMAFFGCAMIPKKVPYEEKTPREEQAVDFVNIATLSSPSGIGMSYLFDKSDSGKSINKYKYEISSNPQSIADRLVSGELDIAALPTYLAAETYSMTSGKIRVISINTLGALYVVEKGKSIKDLDDLKGKTVYCIGEGWAEDHVMKYMCKDAKLDYSYGTSIELSDALVSGKIDIAILQEPYVSAVLAENKDLRRAIDLEGEWNDGAMATECVAVNTEFLSAHPLVVNDFLIEYSDSIKNMNSKEDAAAVAAGFGIVKDAEILKTAIPLCKLSFVSGTEMNQKASAYLKALGAPAVDSNFYFVA